MVRTVGPVSTGPAGEGMARALPPGVAAASSTVTFRPDAASRMAAAKPPIPAPITMTRSCSMAMSVSEPLKLSIGNYNKV